ncbi:MAG: helix-turn-helix domain-containing protein [Rikenellaceae bacterium]
MNDFIVVINNFLLNSLMTILVMGITLISLHNPKSRQKRQIITILSFWVVVMGYFLLTLIPAIGGGWGVNLLSHNLGVCNMELILFGLPCYFTLVSYPFISLRPKILKLNYLSIALASLLLLILIYFSWHYFKGVNPFHTYLTVDIFLQNITTTPVVMRLLIIALFLFYATLTLTNIWKIIPFYNEFTKDYYSQNIYNVSWIRTLIIYYTLITICFLSIIFIKSLYLNTISLLSLIISFFYIINKTLFTRAFEDIKNLGLQWSFRYGWHKPSLDTSKIEPINIEDMIPAIDKWVKKEKPYTKTGFTTEDIIKVFPQLSQEDLRKIFKSKGESFHSYVRECRIKQACHIIETKGDATNLKQVYSAVGFSHYSSFARAFIQLVGVSPSDYIQQQNEKSTRS